MSWKCPCGRIGNLDTAVFCPACGAPKPEAATAEVAPPPPSALPHEPAPEPPRVAPAMEEAPPPSSDAVPAPVEEPAPPRPEVPSVPGPESKRKGIPCFVWVLLAIPACLVLVCLIGIVASIAIPNFLLASQTGKQKRAMAEMKQIATACEYYSTDYGTYPDTGRPTEAFYGFVNAEKLKPFLMPAYTKSLPVNDPWGHPYLYGINQDGKQYVVICTGSDGENKLETIPDQPRKTSCFEDEIVYENGNFMQLPEGPQKRCG